MNLGIFSKIFKRESVPDLFAAIRAAGYSSTQFNMECAGLASMPNRINQEVINAIREGAAAHNLKLAALSGTFNMAHPSPEIRRAGLASLQVLAQTCPQLQIPILTLCTGSRDPSNMWRRHPENHSKQARADFLQTLEAAISMAESQDIWLGIEPEPANIIDSALAASQLIEEIGSSRVKVILDPANLVKGRSSSEDRTLIERACGQLGAQAVLAHAKDRAADGTIRAPGEGVVDFPHFLACLRGIHFNGSLIAHGFEEQRAVGVASYLRATCSNLDQESRHGAV